MTIPDTPAAVLRLRALMAAILAAATLFAAVERADAHSESHGAHVHGLARLAVALDGDLLSLALESPADNLFGFEHSPRTPEQQEAVANTLATLNRPADLFLPTPAANCVPIRVSIESPMLSPPADAHDHQHDHDHEHSHGHADVYAEFHFECAQVAELRGLSVELFTYFSRLERINAEVALPGGQTAARLDAENRELGWR